MAELAITPLSASIEDDDGNQCAAWRLETRDLARGLAGALFVSLPLLFTMEMWSIAKTIPTGVLLAFLGISVIVNRWFLMFAGYRHRDWLKGSEWWDVFTAMGIGAVASTVTLFVAGIVEAGMDPRLILRTIALETVPTSMGAVVAINQLGPSDSGKRSKRLKTSTDLTVLLGSFLGGFLFAFNVAPTLETKEIAVKQDWWLVSATFILSIAVSYMTVHIAQFEERDMSERKIIDTPWVEAAMSYCIAFVLSILMLWIFGYGAPTDELEVWLPQTIALAYATSLGGAAGRLVL